MTTSNFARARTVSMGTWLVSSVPAAGIAVVEDS